jgi:hypothetical protein
MLLALGVPPAIIDTVARRVPFRLVGAQLERTDAMTGR